MSHKAELDLQMMIVEYLTLRYPGVMFRSDLGGIRLNMGQAIQAKHLQGERRGWPDIFIAEPRNGCAGLFGELKTDRAEVYTKKGELKNSQHIKEQWATIWELRKRGYEADFWCGFDEARRAIDRYLL